MPLLLLLGLLSAPRAFASDACPEDASVKALKRDNAAFEQALTVAPDPTALDGAYVRVQTMLGCVEDLPPPVVARSFLLLGAYYLSQGDEFRAGPFVRAAAMLGGESAWLDSLGPDLRTRYFNALSTGRPRGVVYAPELLLDGDFHLVGSQGPPPWIMPVGTFTFEWGSRTVPINVNAEELTLVLPKTFDEFSALVDGVTESDLETPDYDAPIFYDRREHKKQQRQVEKVQREQQRPPPPTDNPAEDDAAGPAVDADSFFDELADLETDDSPPTPSLPPEQPERARAGVAVRPHLAVGGSYTVTGPAGTDAPTGDQSYGGPGVQAGLGLGLHLGQRLVLRPEFGFRSASNAADLDPALFTDEGWGAGIPVEASRNRLLLGYARLPVLLDLGVLSVGAGPAWAIGSAQVTAPTACGEASTCVAPMQGSLMAAGGSLLVGIRPGQAPVVPWLDLGVLHDGERASIAAALVIAWEGSP